MANDRLLVVLVVVVSLVNDGLTVVVKGLVDSWLLVVYLFDAWLDGCLTSVAVFVVVVVTAVIVVFLMFVTVIGVIKTIIMMIDIRFIIIILIITVVVPLVIVIIGVMLLLMELFKQHQTIKNQ